MIYTSFGRMALLGLRKYFTKRKMQRITYGKQKKKIVEETPWAELPSAIIDLQNNLHIIWKDGRNWSEENTDTIYYKRINPNGSVGYNDTRITFENKGCLGLGLIIDSYNMLHVCWFDTRDGNKEIYYKCTLNHVTEPPIIVTQSLNISTCKQGDSITVSGNAVYNNGVVPNGNVSVKILETGDEWTTTTDSNEGYSKTITAPDTAGNYTIRVTVTSGNHTGWKQTRLTVEGESTTNGDTTNGGQQPSGVENKPGINFNYVVIIVGVIAVLLLITGVLLRMKKPSTKVGKTKIEKTELMKTAEKISTIALRCPRCKNTFNVREKPKPFKVKCPFCDKEGEIK